MIVAISGASGFVGQYLQSYFTNKKYEVVILERGLLTNTTKLNEIISNVDVIINLSGANIIQKWTKKHKDILYTSRIETTKALVNAINNTNKEQLFISTSAIGIYANNILCDEEKYTYGDTFLSKLCEAWELEANKVTKRIAIFRLSVILGHGGALHKILLPFKLGLGGVIGDGKQAFSYIHIDDLARAYDYMIHHKQLNGIFNLSTPFAITNKEFTKELSSKLHRPAFIPLPVFILKLIFGEGSQVLTDGQKVYPKRLLEHGFKFNYPKINSVLDDLL